MGRTAAAIAGSFFLLAGAASGQTFKDCAECPEMVVVPAGEFMMGSPKGEPGRDVDEGPQHRVSIPAQLAVGKYEVTFAEWDACVVVGGCRHWSDDQGWGRDNRPVVGVNWFDAREYVDWLGERTGLHYRLLSEAEWEYAARGGTTTPFSTGVRISTTEANFSGHHTYNRSSAGVYRARTTPVGSFPPNPFGLHDVHGNVSEWVEDCWHESYAGAPADGSARTDGACVFRVFRGGNWHYVPGAVRSALRIEGEPAVRDFDLGFRVARPFP